MKTNNILKALAFALLLTTACNKGDEFIINNENVIDENTGDKTEKKGFELPVTVNVTRQGDEDATKATYNESTKKLSFSEGDQLFVNGIESNAGWFAGTLTWASEGTFTGTITTENPFTGTANDLFTAAAADYDNDLFATLLPAGYGPNGYFSITDTGCNAYITPNHSKAFATSTAVKTAKAIAIEQFSNEFTYLYSGGFTLGPTNAILNFTINELTASTAVDVLFADTYLNVNISETVTTDGSGTATFAIAVEAGIININTYSLTVGGNAITLPDKVPDSGKVYNITRSAKLAAQASAGDVGKVIGADGRIYANASAAEAAKTTAVAMICYVGNAGTADASSATYKGLALALTDANNGSEVAWCSHWSGTCLDTQYDNATRGNDMAGIANTYALVSHATHTHNAASAARNYNSGTHPTGTSEWFLPSVGQWNKMITASGGYKTLRTNASLKSDVDTNYWSSTEAKASSKSAWGYSFYVDNWGPCLTNYSFYVRSALAF